MVGNSMTFRMLFPSSYSIEVSKLRQQLDEAHLAWSKEWKERQSDFKIENIRFTHDPVGKSGFSVCKRRTMGRLGSGKPRTSSCCLADYRSRRRPCRMRKARRFESSTM